MNKERLVIGAMFDRVAPRYDFLNHLLSLRRDRVWRKKLAATLTERDRLLDLACGTGDVLLAAPCRESLGVDLSVEMLRRARNKLGGRAVFVRGDALSLPLPDASVDAVTMAFGIRNTSDPTACLREMRRVLVPGGRALILEFSLPESRWLCGLYLAYFRYVLPRVAGWLGGDRAAYQYLNQSAETFPCGDAFCVLMRASGFEHVTAQPQTFGVATIYCGKKGMAK